MAVELNRDLVIKEIAKYMSGEIEHVLERLTRTCITCEHFDKTNELCRQANARPPARVIAYGCEKFSEEIPF